MIIRSITLFLIICAATAQSNAQEIKKTFWDNGQVKSKGAYNASGLQIGKWAYFYDNGKLEAEGSYSVKGKGANTDVLKKRKNSALRNENASRSGAWDFYYQSGPKKASVIYSEGCPSGVFTRWYKTGEKMEERTYKDCSKVASKKIWGKEGWLKFETQVESPDRIVEIEWYKNGQKKSIVPYKRDVQYGRVKRWYPNGQKEEDVMMKNTRVHGYYRSWHPNGKKKREFFSINNVMSGDYFEWNENGNLLWHIKELKETNKIEVVNYWDNGQVKMKGISNMPGSLSLHQWSQTREGQWTYYFRDGSVIKGESYSNGYLQNVEMP